MSAADLGCVDEGWRRLLQFLKRAAQENYHGTAGLTLRLKEGHVSLITFETSETLKPDEALPRRRSP